MKKRLLKIFSCLTLVALLCLGLVACGGSNWDASKVTLKTITAETGEQGGMVAQTENYVYFINGKGDSSGDNTLGEPIKGALYAADKNDLSKTSVIVPKLFVASDYNAGVYVYGGYVYYGTPSTDKNSSGEIAKDELLFAKTKLDGTGTEILFNAGALSTEYRIVKGADGAVYIVYYDSANSAIKSYNATTKETVVVAEKNVEADSESLDEYKFAENSGINDAVVYYTTEVYSAAYSEEDAKSDDYSRSTYNYNKVYAYKAGDGKTSDSAETYGVNVLDGNKVVFETYAVSKTIGKYVQYTVTKNDSAGKTDTYIIDGAKLHGKDFSSALKTNNQDYLSGSVTYLVSDLDSVYYIDSTNLVIKKTTLLGEKNDIAANVKTVAKADNASSLYFVEGDYIYYSTNDGDIARIYIGSERAGKTDELEEQIVSSDSVLTDWFAPKLVKWSASGQEKAYLFYANSGDEGRSYVHAVALDGAIEAEDTDDDGENDKWSLKGNVMLGEMTNADKAAVVDAKITAISEDFDDSGRLVFDEDESGATVYDVKRIKEARTLVDSYKDTAVYDLISEDSFAALEKYENALAISKKLALLEGFSDKTETEKNALSSAYQEAKTLIESIFNADDSEDHSDYEAILDIVVKNLNYEYGIAKEFFTES